MQREDADTVSDCQLNVYDVAEIDRAARNIDIEFAALAVLTMVSQIPLVRWRWSKIVDALGRGREPIRHAPVIAVTAITNFFGQILPNVAVDSVRGWMLTRLGSTWRLALASVLIDRAVGVAILAAVGLVTLMFPSPLASLAGHRQTAIELFGAMLAGAVAGLILARPVAGLLSAGRVQKPPPLRRRRIPSSAHLPAR